MTVIIISYYKRKTKQQQQKARVMARGVSDVRERG